MVTVLVAVVAGSAAPRVDAALFFVFGRTSAAANERVTVRTGGTPIGFTAKQRLKPFLRPIRLYLVPNAVAADVHSRFDPRLEFVGVVVPDRRARGFLNFSVPPLDPGNYAIAYWCPGCAAFSRGRTFVVQDISQFVEPYRSAALLHIAVARACPMTVPNTRVVPDRLTRYYGVNHGNGLLWVSLWPEGRVTVPPASVNADGSIDAKFPWYRVVKGLLTITGRRLDAPAPLAQARVPSGYGPAGFQSTAVIFPSEGCWRITGRIGDVSLTFVTKVVKRVLRSDRQRDA